MKGVDQYTVNEWKTELAELCKDCLFSDIYNMICVKYEQKTNQV